MVFDVDGTLLLADEAVAGAPEAVDAVRADGYKVLFLTNASGRTVSDIVGALLAAGVSADGAAVYSSASSTAAWLVHAGVTHAWVIGAPALRAELKAVGVHATDDDATVQAVVVGLDRSLGIEDQKRLLPASLAARVRRRECMLVGCNRDLTYPGQGGVPQAGCGRVLTLVEAQCGRRADVVVGKPQATMLMSAVRDHGLKPEEVLVVGDSWTSDIEMARRCGCAWAYVPACGSSAEASPPADAAADAQGRVLATIAEVPTVLAGASSAGTR